MNRVVSTLSAAVMVLVSSWARGDAVPPPPANCPTGTEGRSGHNCEYCSAKTCSSSSACAAGSTCKAVKLCVGTVTCVNRTGSWQAEHIRGSCEAGTCAGGSCRSLNVCMPDTTPKPDAEPKPGATPGRGCSCALAALPGGGAGALLLLIAAVVLLRGRRAQT
jgi:hypothetical protein